MGCRCWSSPNTKDAYRLSWASLIITLIAAFSGVALWRNLDSSLALVFGMENCIDFLSSAVVLWRFFAPFKVDPETEERLQRREKRASIAISFVLVALGISIIATSFDDFMRGQDEPFDLTGALLISFFSMPIFGVLTMIKFHYAAELDSASLYKDGICSFIGTLMALALFVNSLIIEGNPKLWWLDPIIAMFGGILAFWIGVKSLYDANTKEGLPIFSLDWWMVSRQTDDSAPSSPAGGVEMPKQPKDGNDNSDGEDDVEDIEIV